MGRAEPSQEFRWGPKSSGVDVWWGGAPSSTKEHPGARRSTQEHPGAHRRTQEHQGAPSRIQETPRSTQKAPRKHPGCTQEHPGGTQETPRGTKGSRKVFEVRCSEAIVFYTEKWRDRPFRVDGSDVTLTVPAGCTQKRKGTKLARSAEGGEAPLPTPQEPLQLKTVGGKRIPLTISYTEYVSAYGNKQFGAKRRYLRAPLLTVCHCLRSAHTYR